MFSQAVDDPRRLPLLILGEELSGMVPRARGAVAYDSEVTAVLSATDKYAEKFQRYSPPRGCFIMPQDRQDGAATTAGWFLKQENETAPPISTGWWRPRARADWCIAFKESQ